MQALVTCIDLGLFSLLPWFVNSFAGCAAHGWRDGQIVRRDRRSLTSQRGGGGQHLIERPFGRRRQDRQPIIGGGRGMTEFFSVTFLPARDLVARARQAARISSTVFRPSRMARSSYARDCPSLGQYFSKGFKRETFWVTELFRFSEKAVD